MNLKELLDKVECGTIIYIDESKREVWANEEHKTIIERECLMDMYYKVKNYYDYDVIGLTVIDKSTLYIVIYKNESD